MLQEAKTLIEKAWKDKTLLKDKDTQDAIRKIIELLDKGDVRVAEPSCTSEWLVNEWIKKAVILYFTIQEIETVEIGPFEFHDKIQLKSDYKDKGVRVVPPAIARYGSFIDKDVLLMPSYINIGAHIESGTIVDTWAMIGSCAQIGKDVHISEGVNIGGVLEPPQAIPVVIEQDCFIGSKCTITEGMYIGKGSILGANVVLSNSTKIIDVTKDKPEEYKGSIPPNSIVIQGSYTKKFPTGNYHIPCALIIGQRDESDNPKDSFNKALKKYKLDV